MLLESGRLIDTSEGEQVPAGAAMVQPSSRDEIAHIRTPPAAEMDCNVARRARLQILPGSVLGGPDLREFIVISNSAAESEYTHIAPMHQFGLRLLSFDKGALTPAYTRSGPEVLLVQSGEVVWNNDAGDEITLGPGDTFTVPSGMLRKLRALSRAEVFVVASDPVTLADFATA